MHRFYDPNLLDDTNELSAEESKHCIQVLRYQVGDTIIVMDGKGTICECSITSFSKKKVVYEIISSTNNKQSNHPTHLAIAPTKNMDRMEWLIEKLSEIGTNQVSFIQTKNSERKNLRIERLEKKAISAMKQSGNPFLLKINGLTNFSQIISANAEAKLIAHVDAAHKHIGQYLKATKSNLILIGPEGDFTREELGMAKQQGFDAVSLGSNTLRTETAGFIACCFVNFINKF